MFSKKPGSARIHDRKLTSATTVSGDALHLRSDIGCGILGCGSCHKTAHQPYNPVLLPSSLIVVPDADVALHNINIFEDPRVGNVLFCSTVLDEIAQRNRGVHARLLRLLGNSSDDTDKRCYLFANDRHQDTYCAVRAQEGVQDHRSRSLLAAVTWLTRHAEKNELNATICLVSHSDALLALSSPSPQQQQQQEHQEQSSAAAAETEPSSSSSLAGVGLPNNNSTTVSSKIMVETLRDYLQKALPENGQDLVDRSTATTTAVSSLGGGGGGAPRLYAPYVPRESALRRVDEGSLFRGKLRVSEMSCFFGEIRGTWPSYPFMNKILLAGRSAMNRGIHDDVVAVELLPVADWRSPSKNKPVNPNWTEQEAVLEHHCTPCGTVVCLLETNRRPYCGSIEVEQSNTTSIGSGSASVLFQPTNGRIPRIRITSSNVSDLLDKRLAVVIDDWSEFASAPVGHYVEILGKIGDRDTEATVILKENDIPHYDFSEAVYDCLPKGEWHVTPDQEQVRLDLRDLIICSVDPLGCRDIDDALHYRVLSNGNMEVGVHIADVTHFLHEHTPMDSEAALRSTSVYLVDRRINMLPQLLTENLCSLVGNEDRYAFSIIWEFNDKMEVVRDWYGKTIIRSRAALYYGDAQKMIDDPNDQSELAMGLKGLMRISQYLKAVREADGALFLASQEFKFKVDDRHVNPTDMMVYQTFEANSMIEEWMLFANAAAAKKVYSVFPRWTLLRRHQRPAEGAFETLNEALQRKIGVTLDDTTSATLNESLARCEDPADPFFNRLIRMLTTRCLRQAQYFSSGEVPYDEFLHFGLAMPIYTHFTSPIRRYADVLVHRQLAAALGIAAVSTEHTDPEAMLHIAANINYRHHQAQIAGRDSQNLFTGFYLRGIVNADGEDTAEAKEERRKEQQEEEKKKALDRKAMVAAAKPSKNLSKRVTLPMETGYVVRVSETHLFVYVPKYGQEGKVSKEEAPAGDDEGSSAAAASRLSMLNSLQLLDRVFVRMLVVQQGDVMRSSLKFEIEGRVEAPPAALLEGAEDANGVASRKRERTEDGA